MSDPDIGTPFPGDCTEPVDSWSRAVFEALGDWSLAKAGRWTRSNDGWLTLRLDDAFGEPLEPLFAIELDTLDGRINLDFGSWVTPISVPEAPPGEAARRAAAEARQLVEGWLRDEVKLASYSDETGWRGSKIIEAGELPAAIEPVPVALDERGQVVVKTWRQSDWRYFEDYGNGIWIERREIGESA